MAWEQGENNQYSASAGTDMGTIDPTSNVENTALCKTPEALGLKHRFHLRILLIVLMVICIVAFGIILVSVEKMAVMVGMPCFFAAFVFFMGFFVLKFTNKRYFKEKVVKAELSRHLDIDYLSLNNQQFSNGLGVQILNMFMGVPSRNNQHSKSDLMQAPCDKDLIDYLGIRASGWNVGSFNDEIRGRFNGTPFRFLDLALYYEYRSGKNNYEREKKYGGQIYMFKVSEPIPIGVLYEIVPGEDYSKPELFSKAFKVKPAIPDGDLPPEVFAEVRKIIETPMMVETMMRFAQLWHGAIWSLRVVDDIMVFTLNREFVDMFELQSNYSETMVKLKTDVDEFVEVIHKASSIDSLR